MGQEGKKMKIKLEDPTSWMDSKNVKTHNLVQGDIAKHQEKLIEQGLYGVVIGQKGELKTISVNDISEAEAQRDTAVTWAYNQIKKRGGIDMDIFDPISVIETAKGYICDDGLGRLAMFQIMGIDTIQAWVRSGNEQQAADRFGHKNKLSIRSVKPESIFSAQVFAKDKVALQLLKQLKTVGLCVKVRTDKVLPKGSKDPEIRINQFGKVFKLLSGDESSKLDVMKQARDIIVDAYPRDTRLANDLFGGLSLLLDVYPELKRPGAPFNQLKTFLCKTAETTLQGKLPYKKDGGNQHNAEIESTAYGLLRRFTASVQCTNQTATYCRHSVIRERFNLTEVRD